MSPLTNNSSNWDPRSLQLPEAAHLQGGNRPGRRAPRVRGKFISGPVDVSWLCQASRLGVTALLVGLALWYIRGLRKTNTFQVSNIMLEEWGVQADAKRRSLRKLERAGLITVERRGKRSPHVTLLVKDFGVQRRATQAWCNVQRLHRGRCTPRCACCVRCTSLQKKCGDSG